MSDKFIQSMKVVKKTGSADKRTITKASSGKVVCNAKSITEGLNTRGGRSIRDSVTSSKTPIDKK